MQAKCINHLLNSSFYLASIGQCKNCVDTTFSMSFTYCDECAKELKKCYVCGDNLEYNKEKVKKTLHTINDLYIQEKDYYIRYNYGTEYVDKILNKVKVLLLEVETDLYDNVEEFYYEYINFDKREGLVKLK